MKNILLVLAFFLFFIITFDLFLKEPPVWPDEASLVQMTTFSRGNLIEDYQHYPSIYVTLLPMWFHISGISIEGQRMLSLLAGLACVVIFYLLLSKISKALPENKFLKIIPLILLVTDFTFLQATRVGRPETITLLFGLSSIYFLFLFISLGFKKIFFLGLSFVLAVLSFAFHMNGFIYLLTILIAVVLFFKKFPRQDQKKVVFSVFILTLFTIIIGLNMLPSLKSIFTRFEIANAQNTWLFTVFNVKPLELKLIYASFITISLLFLFYVFKRRKFDLVVIAFPLITSWLVLIINKDFWYAVYSVPIIYLSAYILLVTFYSEWLKHKAPLNTYKLVAIIIPLLILFACNLLFHLEILSAEGGDRYSYQKYIMDIQKLIPDNKHVFTSAIPDPYYAFTSRKNNLLTRFPQSFVEKGGYISELNNTDYIIYNGPYGSNYYGDTVMQYIKKNTFKVTEIGGPDQYNAIIVELKPKDQRVAP